MIWLFRILLAVIVVYAAFEHTMVFLAVIVVITAGSFAAHAVWMNLPRWDLRGYLKRRKERPVVYKTGDRVRVTGTYGATGLKGTLRSPGMAMFDWIVNLDIGEPMGVYEDTIEPLRWWKFWRSKGS